MAGLSVRDEVDYGKYRVYALHYWHSLHSRWLFAQLTEGAMLHNTTLSETHFLNSHTGQLQPGALDVQT